MNYSISTTYSLVWELKGSENYKFTKDGICINTKTGNRIKKTLNGGSIGYCINGKFVSASKLRKQLIKHVPCPF